MNRRAFLSALGLAAVAVPVAGWATSQPVEPWRPSARAVKRRNRWEMRKRWTTCRDADDLSAYYANAIRYYDAPGLITSVPAGDVQVVGRVVECNADGTAWVSLGGRP